MNTTYSKQIEAVHDSRKLINRIWSHGGSCVVTIDDNDAKELLNSLNDAGSTIAALNLSDPYKEIERLRNELLDALDLKKGEGPTALTMLKSRIAELEKQLAHYADVNQNQ